MGLQIKSIPTFDVGQEGDMTKPYDAIVIGTRCAGSPTAMLLARKGYRVLAVDRATFPSDTVYTPRPPARPRSAEGWGLFDRVVATGCPRSTRMRSTLDRSRSRVLPRAAIHGFSTRHVAP